MFPSLYGAVSQGAAAASWWVVAGKTCVAAYQPIGAASLAASYTNLANPGTYDAAPGVAPTWASATGWTFNGSTQYLATGLQPTAGGVGTVLARYAGSPTSGAIIGSYAGTTLGALIQIISSSGYKLRHFHTTNVIDPVAVGVAGVTGYAGQTAYRNGSPAGSMTYNVMPTYPYFLGAYNNGSPAAYYNGTLLAVAIYSDTLSGAEVATLSAAMAALT